MIQATIYNYNCHSRLPFSTTRHSLGWPAAKHAPCSLATAALLGVGGRVGLDDPRTDAATLERAGYRIQKERTRHKDVAGRRLRSRPTCPDRGVATALWLQSSFHSLRAASRQRLPHAAKRAVLSDVPAWPFGIVSFGVCFGSGCFVRRDGRVCFLYDERSERGRPSFQERM